MLLLLPATVVVAASHIHESLPKSIPPASITALNMSLGDGVNYTSTCGHSLSNPAADQVACFSNSDSASFMTILAPGAMITAAGNTMGGTSQAAPHVAGAIALLRSAFPTDTLDQTVARMTSSGVSITDPRNGIPKPRLNMLAALDPPTNDQFANKTLTNGSSVTVQIQVMMHSQKVRTDANYLTPFEG